MKKTDSPDKIKEIMLAMSDASRSIDQDPNLFMSALTVLLAVGISTTKGSIKSKIECLRKAVVHMEDIIKKASDGDDESVH